MGGREGGIPCRSLTWATDIIPDLLSAGHMRQSSNKKEHTHGQDHPTLGPHPNLPGHVNIVSCTTKMRIWHVPEWGGGSYLYPTIGNILWVRQMKS